MSETSGESGTTLVPVRTRKDIRRAARLLSSASAKKIARKAGEGSGSIHLLVKEGRVLGAIALVRESWEMGLAELRVARVVECTGEVGKRAFRRTGDRTTFDLLVSAWLGELAAAGYHLAYAHGELALWPVHGFVPCFFHPRVYIPTAKALKLHPTYVVRGVKTSDAAPMSRMMARNRHLRPRVFATGVPNFHHYAVEGDDGRIHGYFSMSVTEGNGRPSVFIPEVEVQNREAAETVLAHAAPHAEKGGMRALHFPLAAEHPFASACLDLGGYCQLRGTTRDVTLDEEMVRIVDLKGCLKALEREFSARILRSGTSGGRADLEFDVEGERAFCRLVGEHFQVVDGLGPRVTIQVPRWVLTQLVMGYRSVAELRQRTIRPASSHRLLAVLFPRTWPLSLCDHDLWDPSLRDPDKYCEKARELIRELRYPF